MALIDCPECGKQVSDTAPSCPHCGFRTPQRDTSNISARGWIIISIIILVLGIIVLNRTCTNSDKMSFEQDKNNILEDQYEDSTSHEATTEINIPKQDISVQEKYKYEFRSIKSYGPQKCEIWVRLKGQLTEPELKEIANQVRKDHHSYQRLFIFYLLPGTDIADGAWATSHYNPDIKIEIIGATKEQEEKLKKNKEDLPNTIGKWYCSLTGTEHTITIYKEGDVLKVKQVFNNGIENTEILKQGANGRYDIISNTFKEYYILKKSGVLELWDDLGKFATAKKLD